MYGDEWPLRVTGIASAAESEWRIGQQTPERTCEGWLLVYVKSGMVEELCDTHRVLLRAGQILFHQPAELFAMRAVGEVPPEVFRVEFTADGSAMDSFRSCHMRLGNAEKSCLRQLAETVREVFQPVQDACQMPARRAEIPFGGKELQTIYLAQLLYLLARRRQRTRKQSPRARAEQEQAALVESVRYLGGYDKMEVTLDEPGIDEVVVALDAAEMHMLTRAFAACDKHGTRITMVPFYNDYLPARPTIDVLGDCKLINIRQTPFDNILNAFIKRAMDVVGSLVLIVLTSPIMLGVAIGVKLSSPGPIIFKQERVGLNKRPFMMYKFRSMRVNAAEDSAWSTNSDPRKTRFGSIIRKFSLDELPQFFNVLKGDMSLVGPRPEIPFHVEHFKEEIPRYLVRQQVRPGLTGWAQINGLRGDTDIAERIRYDIWYIENWTVALDIKILFRTVFGGKMVNDEKIQ